MKINFSISPEQPEESCEAIPSFQYEVDTAGQSIYTIDSPPLVTHTTTMPVETKTARKPVVLEPTVIRLNKGLRNLDNSNGPKTERIVLDFGSRDLVSSAVA